jgi:Leucine-rich repeat (LRR) protein
LKELNLQKNFLTVLPSSLFQLDELEYLYVDYNRFSGQLSSGLGELASLQELHLGYNSEYLFDLPGYTRSSNF